MKSAFRKNEHPCTCPPDFPVCVCGKVSKGKVITRKPILPTKEEQEYNSVQRVRSFVFLSGHRLGERGTYLWQRDSHIPGQIPDMRTTEARAEARLRHMCMVILWQNRI